mmetsp:Transcript_26256/g.44803  ORF Transcript_26256/g.44803 Transcript_26256/m.44803 type:complete len:217 (+) Transcript_26256:1262-1912(+)
MRAFAITGSDVDSITSTIIAGSDERATPPSALMSAGMRSRAMTATAPAASAMRACSPSTTSMMTPPCWKTANARLMFVSGDSASASAVGDHGAAAPTAGGGVEGEDSTPHTSLRKSWSQPSSRVISGWKHVPIRFDCRTATTAPSGPSFVSAPTLASTSTDSPVDTTAGARMKVDEAVRSAPAAAPASSSERWRESIWRPKALRLTVMSRPPMSGC